ncbi:SDR family oxidoreductase [Umboniibacter marinipuniceus]|uniref:NAD(P)-dependent dehydrogenase (Short-subunit alcohol dehydrogenase family) n=1 Tax=Umboniibacter marinipuniceus TaxID=569599 RepID=A0A3M0ADM1_9GAMM|nr:SDR family NAD(P)-dependent oxidoreductase [Umboniibacter marinipuniceus]RMA82607.1 NAD(P)-dependent dehydrogenase (short-subunit alcohol dehydrogenase family) [Umboniibacter marinipuniceus]
MNNFFSVAGKVAVVTGGSRGIGEMIATGLLQSGAKVYITARRAEELNATASRLSEFGECIAIASDLSTTQGISQFVAAVSQRETSIDILVNNAGAAWGDTIDNFAEEGFDKVMDLNVKSIFFLVQKFHQQLKQSATQADPARVINIGSINGLTNPKMNNYSYSASKAAVHQLTRHLAADLAEEFITVNAIAPGYFPSKMTAHIIEADDALKESVPLKRLGSYEDAAGTVIYLSSRAGAYVTGHTLTVDGGMVAAAG